MYRDLECQVAVVTDHQGLQEQLREVGTQIPVYCILLSAAFRRLPLMMSLRIKSTDVRAMLKICSRDA